MRGDATAAVKGSAACYADDFMETVKLLVASALGLGLSPIGPGTCGALLGIAMHAAILALPAGAHWPALVMALVAVSAANHWLTPWAQAHWKAKDPRHFVLDEVAGYLIVPILAPHVPFLWTATAGFLLFRLLDIIKLPPAYQIDRNTKGSWGILLDDLVSGAYAALLLALGYRWLGTPAGLLPGSQ